MPPPSSTRSVEAEGRNLRPESYPLLPDFEHGWDTGFIMADGSYAPLAPDGRPWRKACGECAFRTSDPQERGERYQRDVREGTPDSVFYCVHREDNGHTRICACFAACRAGREALAEGRPASSGET